MNKNLLKKLQIGVVSLSAMALLAACESTDFEEPPADEEPPVEEPAGEEDPMDEEEDEEMEEPAEDEDADEE